MKIYLSGAMAGTDLRARKAVFGQVRTALREEGHLVFCPAEHYPNNDHPDNAQTAKLLGGDLEWIAGVDLVVVLPDSEDSFGVAIEVLFAKRCGIPVVTWPDYRELHITHVYDATAEQANIARVFHDLLASASRDGGRKRAAGEKRDWRVECSHGPAMQRHVDYWNGGVKKDKDSGAHPLIHAAWRALAVAYQEG